MERQGSGNSKKFRTQKSQQEELKNFRKNVAKLFLLFGILIPGVLLILWGANDCQ